MEKYQFSELGKKAQLKAIRANRDVIRHNIEQYLSFEYPQNVITLESTGLFNKPIEFVYPGVWFIVLSLRSYTGEDFSTTGDAVIEILQNAIDEGNYFSDEIQKILDEYKSGSVRLPLPFVAKNLVKRLNEKAGKWISNILNDDEYTRQYLLGNTDEHFIAQDDVFFGYQFTEEGNLVKLEDK